MDKFSFICFSINNWEKRRARKQQFMLHLALRQDVAKVLYVEPPLNPFRLLFLPFIELKTQDNRKRWLRALNFRIESVPEAGNLFIFTPLFLIPFSFRIQLIYNLNLYLSFLVIKSKVRRLNFKKAVLWLYHPFDHKIIKWFKDKLLAVFDWAEDWEEYFTEFSGARRKYVASSQEMIIKEADIVFVVSKRLLGRAQKINHNSYQILDGTIPEIFAAYNGRIPDEMKDIPHPVLGYVGVVFTRIDLDLIFKLNEKFPRCSIVLVGNILLPPEKLIKIRQKNIFLLGDKYYSNLPSYMMNFDVCILPYVYELSLSISPTKIYDYLATGKPIVSTSLPELEGFGGLIRLARTKEEFISFINDALNENDPRIKNERLQKAKENSWADRCNEIMALIQNKQQNINS
jgi:hypothetical protein